MNEKIYCPPVSIRVFVRFKLFVKTMKTRKISNVLYLYCNDNAYWKSIVPVLYFYSIFFIPRKVSGEFLPGFPTKQHDLGLSCCNINSNNWLQFPLDRQLIFKTVPRNDAWLNFLPNYMINTFNLLGCFLTECLNGDLRWWLTRVELGTMAASNLSCLGTSGFQWPFGVVALVLQYRNYMCLIKTVDIMFLVQ